MSNEKRDALAEKSCREVVGVAEWLYERGNAYRAGFKVGYDARDEEVKRLENALVAVRHLIYGTQSIPVNKAVEIINSVLSEHESGGAG